METFPNLLILTGSLMLLIGIIWSLVGSYLPLGRLPGDIIVEKENFKVYFPLATSVLVSLILSIAAYFFFLLRSR